MSTNLIASVPTSNPLTRVGRATIAISLVTIPRPDEELKGLVYALTDKPKSDGRGMKPELIAALILAALAVLNVIFW